LDFTWVAEVKISEVVVASRGTPVFEELAILRW